MEIYICLATAVLWAGTVVWITQQQGANAYNLFARLTSRMDDHEKVMMTLRRENMDIQRDQSRVLCKLGEVASPVRRWLKEEKTNPELYDD